MKNIIIWLICFYKKHISPHFPARCKYYPTCSTYAIQAVRKFGAFRGSLLAIWRLLRCNPFSMGGVDFVPDKFTFRDEKYNYYSSGEPDESMHDNDSDNSNERYEN